MLKDKKGEPAPVYSIASGLDYPSVGIGTCVLRDLGRVKYESVTDEEAIEAFLSSPGSRELSRLWKVPMRLRMQ